MIVCFKITVNQPEGIGFNDTYVQLYIVYVYCTCIFVHCTMYIQKIVEIIELTTYFLVNN